MRAGSGLECGNLALGHHSRARQDPEAVLRAGNSALWPGAYLLPSSRLEDFRRYLFCFVSFFVFKHRLSSQQSTQKIPMERAHLPASILAAPWEKGTRWGHLYSSGQDGMLENH